MSTFSARMDELAAEVGTGTVVAKVEFDQAYAHRQHEDLTLEHPHGGGPKFLEGALYSTTPENMQLVADSVLRGGPRTGMILAGENLATSASSKAPTRPGPDTLRKSAHVSVSDNDDVVYDRPALAPRLGPEDIEAINKEVQDPNHWYGRWPRVIGE